MSHSKTIYLVDDDASARKGLAKFLIVAGLNVEVFSSVEDFFQTQTLPTNACLIIDAWVSDLSGMDLATVFAENNVNIPVFFLSAREDEASRDRAFTAKASGFFRKPVDGPALLDAIAWEIETNSRNKKVNEQNIDDL